MGDIGPQDLIYRCSGKWVTEDFPAAEDSVLRYTPGGDLIRRYHERWREERLLLNPPVSNN